MSELIRFSQLLKEPEGFILRAGEIAQIPSPRMVALRYDGPSIGGARGVKLEVIFDDQPGALRVREIRPSGESVRHVAPSAPDALSKWLREFFTTEGLGAHVGARARPPLQEPVEALPAAKPRRGQMSLF